MENSFFIIDEEEYWEFPPPGNEKRGGILRPSSYLRIIDGILYQWWPSYIHYSLLDETKKGVWVKVPQIYGVPNKI